MFSKVILQLFISDTTLDDRHGSLQTIDEYNKMLRKRKEAHCTLELNSSTYRDNNFSHDDNIVQQSDFTVVDF